MNINFPNTDAITEKTWLETQQFEVEVGGGGKSACGGFLGKWLDGCVHLYSDSVQLMFSPALSEVLLIQLT